MGDEPRKHWVSVAAAIVNGDRVLAIRRRDNNKWEPPGGTLERDETILEGLRREILEETGLKIDPGPLTGVYKNMQEGIVALVFRCTVGVEEPRRSDEAAEVQWFTTDELEERMDPAYACRLVDAMVAGPPTIRSHDGVNLLR